MIKSLITRATSAFRINGMFAVLAILLTLGISAQATESAAATAGGVAITALVGDVNFLGAIFMTVVAALAVWNLVSHFLTKRR